jgi:wyosine [tRNA(Phe)-imidazoG37] synthetase (radical SAM superfamily)
LAEVKRIREEFVEMKTMMDLDYKESEAEESETPEVGDVEEVTEELEELRKEKEAEGGIKE